ncbi:MAG: phosphoglycerate kinase, partial [Flavobacteriales bacterium]|nr:phosphoglycerate kinase [Flavobacteriales bacterium]
MLTMDTYSFANKKALIRVDMNVPQDEGGSVTDDTRLRAILPTVNKVLADGGSAILMSHLGRP